MIRGPPSKRRALASFLLILYLSSPYLNIFSVPLASASSPPPQQPNGIPLPPGTVSYRNTWNATAPACPTTPTTQPLVPITSWNKTLKIPTQLFNWSPDPNGRFITQSFTVSSNGTFSVSDDTGNRFSIAPLGGLPAGISTVSLLGNSTVAEQRFVVSAGPLTLANVLVTYSVKTQFCQPSGIKLTISGTAVWPSRSSVLSVPFKSKPISVRGDRAIFGNASGVSLGFDWSDSRKLAPTFDNHTSTLSYTVGPTFSIDPVTVGTTTQSQATMSGYQRLAFYTLGQYWAFYNDGANYVFRTSSDGFTWSSPTIVRSQVWSGEGFAVWYNPSTNQLYYAVATFAANFAYRYGTLTSSGTISWAIPETLVPTTCGGSYNVSIALDSNGNPWVAVSLGAGGNCSGQRWQQVFEYTTSWISQLTIQNNGGSQSSLSPMARWRLYRRPLGATAS